MKRFPLLALLTAIFCAGVLAQSQPDTSSRTIFRPTRAQITEVQDMFKARGEYNGTSTGRMNPEIRAAIRRFQGQNGLRATGTLNRATLEALGIELTESQKAIPVSPNSYATPPPAGETRRNQAETRTAAPRNTEQRSSRAPIFRANKDQIIHAQKTLRSAGFYSGGETGRLDNPTRQGLRQYQRANDIRVTGTLNAVTLRAMGIELTERQKEIEAATVN